VRSLGLALAAKQCRTVSRLEEGAPLSWVTIQPVLVPLENKRVFGLGIEVRQSSIAEPAGLLTGDVLIGAASQLFNTPQDLLKALCKLTRAICCS